MADTERDIALNRAQALLDARGDTTIDDLRETLRLVLIVMALRDYTPFARPMGERGRPLEFEPDPYLPRPALQAPRRRGRFPGPRLPRPEEFRLRRVD